MTPPFRKGQCVMCRAFNDASTGKTYPAERGLKVERVELIEHAEAGAVWFVAAGNIKIRIDAPADMFELMP